MGIVLSVFALGIVVAIHELGHFAVAKWCRVGVIEYALGFGKAIFSRRIGDTRYSLRSIPLGGYVRMVGDDPYAVSRAVDPEQSPVAQAPALATPEQWAAPDSKDGPDPLEQELMADRSKWFLTKGVGAKSAIVLAGPFANLISALALAFVSVCVWGATEPINLPIIGQTLSGYPAAKAGMMMGDKVFSVDGQSISSWEQLSSAVSNSGGKEMVFDVERSSDDGKSERVTLKITGVRESSELEFLDKSLASAGFKIGIAAAVKRVHATPGEAVTLAASHIGKLVSVTLRGVVGLVTGKISLKNIGGPIFIFGESMRSAKQGVAALIDFMVFLSVSLAVFNLLPIPVLDGGHLVFFLVEAVKGKPVSLRVMEVASQVGMVFILAMTVLAVGNDVLRLIHG